MTGTDTGTPVCAGENSLDRRFNSFKCNPMAATLTIALALNYPRCCVSACRVCHCISRLNRHYNDSKQCAERARLASNVAKATLRDRMCQARGRGALRGSPIALLCGACPSCESCPIASPPQPSAKMAAGEDGSSHGSSVHTTEVLAVFTVVAIMILQVRMPPLWLLLQAISPCGDEGTERM